MNYLADSIKLMWNIKCIRKVKQTPFFYSLFRKLKRLNIGGNDLNRVPTDALTTLESLRKLEIQENQITELREGDFKGNTIVYSI